MDGTLNLGIGQPAQSLLPTAETQRAAAQLATFDGRHVLQYGSLAGSGHYLSAVASFLSAELGYDVSPNSLFASSGNSGGLALVVRALTERGDTVLMEDPSYFLAHGILRDYGLQLMPARQRSDGLGTIDVDALGGALDAAAAEGQPSPTLLYCVPTGNNPRGTTMPNADRAKLVAICAAHRITIVADDVDEMCNRLPAERN